MFTALLIVGAAALLYADKGKELVAAAKAYASQVEPHRWLAYGLLGLAAFVWWTENRYTPEPEPTPIPVPVATLDLRGKFVGPTAAEDAAAVSAICDEIARELEWDGMQAQPYFKTGVQFDELRIRTRTLYMKGESLGDRHPLAREAIERYLNDNAGTSGGPLTPEGRARWVAAYRDVALAAEAAFR